VKGQPRSRPAPTIGQRVVVRFVPLPADRREAWNKQIGKMIDRGLKIMADERQQVGAA
jgi:hypothetical protein